jgi:two-component sensor histidine kinase
VSDRRASVLYIDDDEGLRLLARRSLERRGYEVVTADGGEQGLALARDRAFDLIAVDHYMPAMDGLATLEALNAGGVQAPVVYVTGSEESRIAVAALKAGAADYVVKTIGDDFFDLLDRAFKAALDQVAMRRARDEAEAALLASNERLATLLREVNHRVANSLQLVSAFVHMQVAGVSDGAARSALADTQRRIAAIAQVHRRLYTSDDVEAVEMGSYLEALVGELEETWSTPGGCRTLLLSAEPVRLHTDQAVSVGVIVNELVSNACKYAYAADSSGEVRISLTRDEGGLVLTVEDDGPGLVPGAKPTGSGLGGRIISAMAGSLKSTVQYDPAHKGVRATLRIAG